MFQSNSPMHHKLSSIHLQSVFMEAEISKKYRISDNPEKNKPDCVHA